jgi:hypothetical protein
VFLDFPKEAFPYGTPRRLAAFVDEIRPTVEFRNQAEVRFSAELKFAATLTELPLLRVGNVSSWSLADYHFAAMGRGQVG